MTENSNKLLEIPSLKKFSDFQTHSLKTTTLKMKIIFEKLGEYTIAT